MANKEHLNNLKKGIEAWNEWRKQNPRINPDLREAHLIGANLFRADLSQANLRLANLSQANLMRADLRKANLMEVNLTEVDLRGANLKGTNLKGANLSGTDLNEVDLRKADLMEANLIGANLRGANLSQANLFRANLMETNLSQANLFRADLFRANLMETNLSQAVLMRADLSQANLRLANLSQADLRLANLSQANLSQANLMKADLSQANLSQANLNGANLSVATLVRTNLDKADLTSCRIYGISAWDLNMQDALQSDLIITRERDPAITVDNLEVAQFIYLLLNNEKLRDVIDTITSKVVLILGRFTSERKVILDSIREELRKRNYLPILFDFEKPSSRNTTETITLLARMARFVIADITNAKSIPQELYAIVPHLPSVPVQPLLESSQKEYGMFESFRDYPWVLKTYYYESIEEILGSLKEKIINPAEEKAQEIAKKN